MKLVMGLLVCLAFAKYAAAAESTVKAEKAQDQVNVTIGGAAAETVYSNLAVSEFGEKAGGLIWTAKKGDNIKCTLTPPEGAGAARYTCKLSVMNKTGKVEAGK